MSALSPNNEMLFQFQYNIELIIFNINNGYKTLTLLNNIMMSMLLLTACQVYSSLDHN